MLLRAAVVALSATMLLSHATGSAPFLCGNGHPAFESHLESRPKASVAQDYHTETLYAAVDRFRARARRAQDESPQTYSPLTSNVPGPGFVPLSTLHATGQDGPLRVGIVWDNVNTGAKDGNTQRQCVTIGQSITVSSGNPAPNQDTSYICQAADLVTQGTPRYNQMVLRTATALGYWASTLRVRPVQNPITISPDIVNNYHLTTTSVNNVDLVIVMTAEPSPDVAIAGYAKCMQVDQFARCTVGLFNWVPALLDLVNANSPTTITSELHTAIHEIVHVLGGMGPGRVGDTPFIDDTGNPRSGPNAGVYTVLQDPAYPSVTKPVMYITTPRVLNITRTQLACDTMPGFPLEDLPLGAGVHWEARLAGGELMSYGTYSTITYVSDLTLAFLEDTNQYIANYSMAGKIPTGLPDTNDFSVSTYTFLQENSQSTNAAPYTIPPPPSPGALLWGYQAGCSVWTGAPNVSWPALDAGMYCTRATKDTIYGCTADNRMSATCVVYTGFTGEPACDSMGNWDDNSGSAQCGGVPNPALASGGHGIPPVMRWYGSDAAAAVASGVPGAVAASTGGELSAMDYSPVYMGYWACQDSDPVANVSASTEQGFDAIFSQLFGSPTDMSLFGGQARCTDCRCFQSSLLELTRGANPTFPVYGLCYRFNCYRADYLQIGVRGQLGSNTLYWYGCPVGGGKVYIPGFTGALHCPDPVAFCAKEAVSGVKFAEQNPLYEAIFWGIIAGLTVLMLLACMCPCTRNPLITCCKRACGALQFEDEYVSWTKSRRHLYVDSMGVPVAANLDCCGSWYLFLLNSLTLLAGCAMFGILVYAIALSRAVPLGIDIVLLAGVVVIVSGMGVCASRARSDVGPSCWVLSYFFSAAALFLMLLWAVLYMFAFNGWRDYVSAHWDEIQAYLPAQYYSGSTQDAQIASATSNLQKFMWAGAGIAAGILGVHAVALYAASRIIHLKTLVTMTLCVLGYIMVAYGIVEAVVGLYIVATGGLSTATAKSVVEVIIIVGFWFIILGVLAEVGVFRRSRPVLIAFIAACVGSCALLAVCIWVFVSQGQRITDVVNGMTDADVATIVQGLHLTMSRAEIIIYIQSSLTELAIAAGIGLLMVLILAVDAAVYMAALRQQAALGANVSSRAIELYQEGNKQVPVMKASSGRRIAALFGIKNADAGAAVAAQQHELARITAEREAQQVAAATAASAAAAAAAAAPVPVQRRNSNRRASAAAQQQQQPTQADHAAAAAGYGAGGAYAGYSVPQGNPGAYYVPTGPDGGGAGVRRASDVRAVPSGDPQQRRRSEVGLKRTPSTDALPRGPAAYYPTYPGPAGGDGNFSGVNPIARGDRQY